MSRPSAPGVSVDLSGAARVAARRVRRLGKPVLIDFETEGSENELMAWYRGRADRLVRALQLRREREGPYFHQFVVFELKDGGGLFRIDRRLRPDEDAPLNSLKDDGIPAYDTIEPVIAWDDPLFPTSDCLISIEFKVDVYLALILKICRAIQRHPLAKVYTLQRYNCYFFAQTIIMWAACGAADWASTGNRPPELVPRLNSNKGFLELNQPAHEHADYSELRHASTPITTQFTYQGYTLTLTLTQRTYLPTLHRSQLRKLKIATPSSEINVNSLRNKIDASVQHLLETHWREEPIRKLLCEYLIKRSVLHTREDSHYYSRSRPTFNKITIEVRSVRETGFDSGPTGALIFWTHSPPIHMPSDPVLAGETRSLWNKSQPRQLDLSESFGISFSNLDQWKELSAKFGPLGQVHETINNTHLDSFKQNMAIQILYGATVQQDTPQETTPNSNLDDIPRYWRPHRTIFQRLPHRTIFQWRKSGMTPATIIEMQKYLLHLIRAHSIRVEQYKWATKAIATDVASDIRRATNEIWGELVK
ncbi:hypothetical protein ACGC1H_003944 [Rhizoctonia solani]